MPYPMTETDLTQYRKDFLQMSHDKEAAIAVYLEQHSLTKHSAIDSYRHPGYFQIQANFSEVRQKLDAPVLASALCKIGHYLTFKKTNRFPDDKEACGYKEKIWLSYGIVTSLHTSDDGSGEIVYCFDSLIPPCPETNPYCLESEVLSATVFFQNPY